MIVLEGVDSSGKSTLAEGFHNRWGWPVVRSRGPARDPEEINDRLDEYESMGHRVIFDRHPIISESLYGRIARRPNWMEPHHYARFWSQPKLIIFCRPSSEIKLAAQTNLGIDTPEYVAHLEKTRVETIAAYDYFFSRLGSAAYVTYNWRNMPDVLRATQRHIDLVEALQPVPVG